MRDLRAARWLEHVVVTGGRDCGWDGGNSTDEVSVDLINQVTSLHVQVPQYEETAGTWSEIGRMKKARSYHAVVAVVDLSLFCPGIVVRQIRNNYHHHHRHHHRHHHHH